jgi:hypothetical protein
VANTYLVISGDPFYMFVRKKKNSSGSIIHSKKRKREKGVVHPPDSFKDFVLRLSHNTHPFCPSSFYVYKLKGVDEIPQ